MADTRASSGYRANTRNNLPLYSLGSAILLLLSAVIAVVVVDPSKQSTPVFISVMGLILTTVPSLLAAAFAERTARDVRNGVVEEKVRNGAHQAMREAGVITREGPAVTLAMESLAALLKQNTKVTEDNTAATEADNGKDVKP